MDEKDLQEFTLDEIMKEFSDQPETVPEVEIAQDMEESAEEAVLDQEIFAQAAAAPIADEPMEQTIRLDAIDNVRGQVRNAQPVEEEVQEYAPQQPEKEAFTEGCEP